MKKKYFKRKVLRSEFSVSMLVCAVLSFVFLWVGFGCSFFINPLDKFGTLILLSIVLLFYFIVFLLDRDVIYEEVKK